MMSSVNHGGAAGLLEPSAAIVTLPPLGSGRSLRLDAPGLALAAHPARQPLRGEQGGDRRIAAHFAQAAGVVWPDAPGSGYPGWELNRASGAGWSAHAAE